MSNAPSVATDTSKPATPGSDVKPDPQQNQESKPEAKPGEQQK